MSKIYTKTGDKGLTSLWGGRRVPKCDLRIEAYGTIDELNSWIGKISDQDDTDNYKSFLIRIQNKLFTIGSFLAADPDKNLNKVDITEEDIFEIETEIDIIDKTLRPLKNFILPSGHPHISNCHIARTVCRRAERRVVELNNNQEGDYNDIIIYLNRLSDYLFILARAIANIKEVEEVIWKGR